MLQRRSQRTRKGLSVEDKRKAALQTFGIQFKTLSSFFSVVKSLARVFAMKKCRDPKHRPKKIGVIARVRSALAMTRGYYYQLNTRFYFDFDTYNPYTLFCYDPIRT